MKFISALVLLLWGMQLQAQFAIVRDKDGYTNVREGAGVSKKIIGKLLDGMVAYIQETEGEWHHVEYYRKHEITSGYIHRSRLIPLDSFASVKVRQQNTSSVVFQQDSITVMFTTKPFVEKDHKIENRLQDGYTIIDKIDGKIFYGSDGGLPVWQYNTFTIQIGNRAVLVPDYAIRDLYNPNPELTSVCYDRKNDRLYIVASNSDGAGSYDVLLQFDRGEYSQRAIFYGF
ncbi:SH3 domain-containing protein [Chitinophaga qingshengii]|uniref:SH3b domain-containing protein n=1 Tax=Chitinophaga qingshengii TaxID=1569794 RepID=A0ABR7TID7_9BACT|nr:SH3 domain-containing protein [Chitinophaga qingshengii]MBC9930260.1 hypothetical protein [Chitinophaga qingshengii]